MTTRRPARHTPTPQPLLSHSTLRYLGHWRGQLLITSIVLFIGFIYFIIRDPIERWQRRRREQSSARARGALLALESREKRQERETRDEDVGQASGANGHGIGSGVQGQGAGQGNQSADRGRAGKKERRRKGSLLRVNPGGQEGSTGGSAEGSPAPSVVSARGRKSSTASQATTAESVGVPASAIFDIPTTDLTPTPTTTPTAKNKGKAKAAPLSRAASSTATPQIRLKAPEEISPSHPPPAFAAPPPTASDDPTHLTPETSTMPLPIPETSEAWSIPLPPSPFASSSRLIPPPAPASISSISTDGRSDVDSVGEVGVEAPAGQPESVRSPSMEFSICPEDGYLPPSVLSGRKKKRGKGRGTAIGGGGGNASGSTSGTGSPGSSSGTGLLPSTFSALLDTSESAPSGGTAASLRRERQASTSSSTNKTLSLIPESLSLTTSSSRNAITSPPPTPSKAHLRKASLGGRPFGMDLEALLVEREKTIDTLRAEIGVAKAEGAKAREEAEEMKKAEEGRKKEMKDLRDAEKLRRGEVGVEVELRRREVELQRQLSHTNQLLAAQAARLAMIEQLINSAGLTLPPPPSPLPTFQHIPMNGHGRISSMPTSPMPASPSPHGMVYSSPHANGAARMAYPSPSAALGQFPTTAQAHGMLHPSFAQHQQLQQQQQHYALPIQQQLHLQQAQLHHQQQHHHHHHPMQSSHSHSHSPSPAHSHSSPNPNGRHSIPISPSAFRRSSSTTEPDHILAGPLTPGILPYPSESGLGRPKSASASGSSPVYRLPTLEAEYEPESEEGESEADKEAGAKMDVGVGVGIGGEMDEAKRASIAFTVMKVKETKKDGGVGVMEGVEGDVEGLGMGSLGDGVASSFVSLREQGGEDDTILPYTNGSAHPRQIGGETENYPDAEPEIDIASEINSGHSSSSRTSTSPSPKRLLVTPGAPDLFPDTASPSCPATHPNQTNGEHGGPVVVIRTGRGSRSSSGSGRGRLGLSEALKEDTAEVEVYTPTFASLAHTPDQLKEIARMRDIALRRYATAGTERTGMGETRGREGRV